MILAVPLLFLLVHIYSVSAASGVAAYYVGPGETYMATLDGRVRKITNATSYTLFVPVRTLTEQQSFLNNLPAGVTALTNACEWETTAILWGTEYPIVGIGSQCWMAKNLNYATGSNWCYNNNTSNCTTYGRLYDWSTAMVACPTGWRLPSDAEFTTLTNTTGNTKDALVAAGWFNSIFPGRRGTDGWYNGINMYAYFWSSSLNASDAAWLVNLNSYDNTVGRWPAIHGLGQSVRCIKN